MLGYKRKNLTISNRPYIAYGTIAITAVIGVVMIFSTRASTPYVANEVELGTLSNGAVRGTDTTASAGSYVKFPAPTSAAIPTSVAEAWIANHFSDITPRTGIKTGRQNVETPAYFKNYTGTGGKYGIDAYEKSAPDDRRIGLVNVKISANVSTDIYGASLYNANTTSGTDIKWYMKNVTVEPDWPNWISYSATNYDGITLDNLSGGTTEIYAEDLTVRKWNADAGIDNKSAKSQFVRLTIEGAGNRSLRLWRPGPHYIVDSRIDNPGGLGNGVIVWMKDCSTTDIRVWNSTFNGTKTIPSNKIKCEAGTPNITYLTKDPRTTGEMHPMLTPR